MAFEIKVPQLGESITEGVLVQWYIADGEVVSADEPLFELETDKVTLTVPSPAAGTLQIVAQPGATVTVGQVVGRLQEAAAVAQPAVEAASPSPEPEPTAAPAAAPAEVAPPTGGGPPGGAVWARQSPAVRRMVAEYALDPAGIPGTGPGGRITKADVLHHRAASPAASPSSSPAEPSGAAPSPVVSSPADGAGGLDGLPSAAAAVAAILVGQSIAAPPPAIGAPPPSPQPASLPSAAPAPAAPLAAVSTSPAASAPPATDSSRLETRRPMTRLRQRIAERLVQGQQSAAVLTTFNEVDMTSLLQMRTAHKASFEERHGVRLGIMSFFVKAAADALRTVPALNARIDGDQIVQYHYCDIGVAIGSEHGLVVPVLRNVERSSFADIERNVADLAARAAARRLTLDELQGGSMTVSNGGVYGSLLSTPLLNPPQSSVLGLHGTKRRPVAVGESIEIRPMMYLALSYDHRLVDGREAVTFLKRIVECVEHPERMLLEA